MINYFQLPDSFYDFLKPYDLKNYTFHNEGHDWIAVNVNDFLNIDGINWFESKGFKLQPIAGLFKISSNTNGPIHTDNPSFAFNFTLAGKGDMQWISDIDATEYKTHHQGRVYSRFSDIKSFNVADTWSSGIALVRVNTPHRIISTDSERYCLSIRTLANELPITFEDALSLINN